MGEPKVSVSILQSDTIDFEIYGNYSSPLSENLFSGKYKVEIDNHKIKLTENGKIILERKEVILNPIGFQSDSFLIENVVIGVNFHWEQKENQRFIGALKFIIESNKITAVNILPVEDYLQSVISSEMSATSSLELLKAHAVISRSWLLAQIEKSKSIKESHQKYNSSYQSKDEFIKWYDREDHLYYDVCNDDHCQRYQGITKAYTEKVKEAVGITKGVILKYNGKICDARFSKSCGGISENFENVWEPVKHNYLSKVIDYKYTPDEFDLDLTQEAAAEKWIRNFPQAFCNTDNTEILSQVLLDYDQKTKDFYRWKVEYTQEEISELIKLRTKKDFGNILNLVPVERGVSGRLIKLKIIGSKLTLTIGKELEIRRTLSQSHLYSSAFVVDKYNVIEGVPGKFIITGAGWGHGVGLCQIGAAVMGEQGYGFDEILLHYFKGAQIQKIY